MIDFSGESVNGYFVCTNNFLAMEATPQSSYIGNNLPNNSLVDCTGNTYIGQVTSKGAATFPDNTYLSAYPSTGSKVFIQPNSYEPLRGQIAIFNYAKASSVTISLASLGYAEGDTYTLHNAANYWGDMVTGVYNGSSVTVDMQAEDHSVAAPIGVNFQKEPTSFPDFGAFIIESGNTTGSGGGGNNPTPPPVAPVTISSIPAQTTLENTATAPIVFTLGNAPANLTLTVSSSNPVLAPVANIVLGGTVLTAQ